MASTWLASPSCPLILRWVDGQVHFFANLRGLGDLVAWALGRVGIRPVDACGCDRRQKRLNRWFPFDVRRAVGPVEQLVVHNASGAPLTGRLQVQRGTARYAVTLVLADREVVVLQPGLPAGRARDHWSWILSSGGGVATGHMVCTSAHRVELWMERADGALRLRAQQPHGACVIELVGLTKGAHPT